MTGPALAGHLEGGGCLAMAELDNGLGNAATWVMPSKVPLWPTTQTLIPLLFGLPCLHTCLSPSHLAREALEAAVLAWSLAGA